MMTKLRKISINIIIIIYIDCGIVVFVQLDYCFVVEFNFMDKVCYINATKHVYWYLSIHDSCAKFASIDCLTLTIIFRDRLKNCQMICFWFVFNIRNRFINRIENESKTNQNKCFESKTNHLIISNQCRITFVFWFGFDSFWIRFWFV